MAETAPLTTAHTHSQKAAEATQHIHWSEAADEHQHAASEYARAARTTSDLEALRVLKLLEDQHAKLARIIRTQDTTKTVDSNAANVNQPITMTSPSPIQPKSSTTALAAARVGSQVRDSSPSLARDIASRRGIPQARTNPPSAAAQARARQLSPESHRRNRAGPAPKIPPSVMDSQNLQPVKKPRQTEDDEGFTKFYSNLTSGTMSKLSSVLAFAGLPLTADEIQPDRNTQKIAKRTVSASSDPDVQKLFSKAALNAIEDEHRQRGTQGHVFRPAESFYVVQKSGGTYSYADIVKPQQSGSVEEDDEDAFVDAQEAQGPASPRHSRLSSQSRNSFGKSRTQEELELENTTLKSTLEQLAIRLAEFEAHAQDASMAALTQSMVGLNSPGLAVGPDLERIRQLEKELEQSAEERQKLRTLAAKQDKTLKQYKSKWDDIKKNAKEKDRAKKERAEMAAADAAPSTPEPS